MSSSINAATVAWGKLKAVPASVWLGSGIILLAVLVVYLPALGGGFIWDDDAYVTENLLLTAPDGLRRIWFSAHSQSQYFPMTYTTLRLERALWGLNPAGYHAVNVLFHAVNALLAWTLLRRLAIPGAWLAAALFALHPVQVESAAWITELKNTQSTCFYLLALLAWVRFIDQKTTRPGLAYGMALVLHTLALFSKTTACTLPAALVLVCWLKQESIGWRRLAQVVPFLLLSCAMGLVSVWWEGHLGNYVSESGVELSLLERLLVASRALWFYAGKLGWPFDLAFSYPRWQIDVHDFRQYGWLFGCLAVAALLWFSRRRLGRGTLVAAAFYVATLSPMLGFFPLYTFVYSFVADHYQYLACLGPLALLAAGMTKLAVRWRIDFHGQIACCCILLSGIGLLTWRQAGAYRTQEALWRDTLKKNPNSWLALNSLGLILSKRGETVAAETHIREALRLNPNQPDIFYALGNLLVSTGRPAEAIPHYERAAQLRPVDADIRNNLGVALYLTRQFNRAIPEFQSALQHRPGSASVHCNLGNALLALRRRNEAIEAYTRALQLNPDYAEAKARLRALGRLPVDDPGRRAHDVKGAEDN